MENILNAILSQIDEKSIQAISRKTHTDPQKAQNALATAIPVLMNALARNSNTPEGAAALQNALQKDHDGSILDNLGAFLNNPQSLNGAGILKHVLGNKRQSVEQYISNDTGLSGNSVSQILEMAAPMVMGYLGKQTRGTQSQGVAGLLESFLRSEASQAPGKQSMITQLLDRDNDGSILDDIAEMGMSFLKRKRR